VNTAHPVWCDPKHCEALLGGGHSSTPLLVRPSGMSASRVQVRTWAPGTVAWADGEPPVFVEVVAGDHRSGQCSRIDLTARQARALVGKLSASIPPDMTAPLAVVPAQREPLDDSGPPIGPRSHLVFVSATEIRCYGPGPGDEPGRGPLLAVARKVHGGDDWSIRIRGLDLVEFVCSRLVADRLTRIDATP
jgi:hypothetical protein